MIRRLLAYLAMAVVATTGLALAGATPAYAQGGCLNSGWVRPCFNYTSGSYANADFYLERSANYAETYYRVWFVVNGTEYSKTPTPVRFGAQGRHCCWTHHVDNLPNSYKTAFTRVRVYMGNGVYHYTVNSPSFSFWS